MELQALLERPLIIVAHPDDESVGCGILLQRAREPQVVFCTDGAPRASQYWEAYGSRERYGEVRRQEARSALRMAGVENPIFLSEGKDGQCFVDQDLFLAVPNALHRIFDIVEDYAPTALLTHAYEGGHPDHDACAFLAYSAGKELGISVWEFPLYHRKPQGEFCVQQFLISDGSETRLSPTQQELERKQRMISQYNSQKNVLAQFDPAVECFRPMPAYDFSNAPHPGTLNYESWGWSMTGKQLCAAFCACSQKRSLLDLALLPPTGIAA